MRAVLIGLMVLLCGVPAAAQEALRLGPAGQRTAGLAWRGGQAGERPPLLVVLHGDASAGPPDYQYRFAEKLVQARPDAVVAALLRPGYADPAGRRSDGRRGWTTGDNYTPEVLDQLTLAIAETRRRYRAGEVVLVGHSGGAALAALLLARRPRVAQRAVLVACPCDLAAFRRHMAARRGSPLWRLPVRSLSPIEAVERIAPGARVTLLAGSADTVTPPALSRAFVGAARRAGVDARLVMVPGAGHDLLLHPAVIAAVR